VVERLENPGVGDTVARLCLDGSNRQPKFILPSVRDRLAAGAGVEGLALVSALWCRYLGGPDEAGRPIAIADEAAGRLASQARAARTDPAGFLRQRDIFGDLADAQDFARPFARHLEALWRDGVEATLTRYVGGG
jgi:mannitol 2-dehydrogenase